MNYQQTLRKLLSAAILCFGLYISANAQEDKTFIAPSDANIVYMGRISTTQPGSVRFTYPGVSIMANFEGTSLQMAVKKNSGGFMVEIDNFPAYRIDFGENDSIKTLAEGLPQGIHSARIMYVIEGYELKPAFRGFYLDKGCQLAQAPVLPQRRIEFIGNSITCGYGVESEDPSDPFSYETENHYYTYAAQTARLLNAQHLVVARSGIGIYRNYGAPKSGSRDCMPAMYEQTLFMDSTETWNHALYTPDVVCLNLGTNDMSLDNYDANLLEEGYRKFVKHLRTTYPKAQIVLLTGPLMNGKPLEIVKIALDKIADEHHRQGDTKVYRFDFSPQTGSLAIGASWHPSLRQHMKMASELTPFIQKITGWTTAQH